MTPKVLKLWKSIILDIGVCQICNTSRLLDSPHHSHFGNGGADKDDRYLVCICKDCHSQIHHKEGGYDSLSKTREETKAIGEDNWTTIGVILSQRLKMEEDGYEFT